MNKYLILLSLILIINCEFSGKNPVAVCENYNYEKPNIFYVDGEGIYSSEPKIGVVRFGIVTKRVEADEALAANKRIIQKATTALYKLNDEVTITTSGLRVTKSYKWVNNSQVFEGYQVDNNIVLKSCNTDMIGRFIDAAIKNGITQIESVSFELDPEEQKANKNKLIELAVKDAQQRATRLLDAINYQIVTLKSVNIHANGQRFREKAARAPMALTMMADGGSNTAVFAGEKRQSQKVTLGFIIAPKN